MLFSLKLPDISILHFGRFSKEIGIKKGIEVANQHNKLIELGFAYEYPETHLIRTKKIGLDELYHKINSDNNSSAA